MAIHSSTLAWIIPWTEEPGTSYAAVHGVSRRQTQLSDFTFTFHFHALEKAMVRGIADAAAKSLQSCPTLCDPIDSSPPGSSVLGIVQARTLEWVAISFSNA